MSIAESLKMVCAVFTIDIPQQPRVIELDHHSGLHFSK